MITQVLAKVGSLFLILTIGVIARFRKVVTEEVLDNLCKIVVYVTLPFLFIYTLTTRCNRDAITSLWMAPLFAFSIIATGYVIGSIAASLLKLPPKRRDALIFLISFQNSGFLAIPIGFALFGESGVLAIVIFSIGFNLALWTFGVWLIKRSSDKKELTGIFSNVINTGTIALALGVLFGTLCIKLPNFFMDASRMLGNATIPLAMFVVGAILASGKSKEGASFKEMSAVVICRLIIIPLLYLGFIKLDGELPQLMKSILLLQACMPSASLSALFARRFGGDYNLAANGIFYTTLISIITIPVFMSFIK